MFQAGETPLVDMTDIPLGRQVALTNKGGGIWGKNVQKAGRQMCFKTLIGHCHCSAGDKQTSRGRQTGGPAHTLSPALPLTASKQKR